MNIFKLFIFLLFTVTLSASTQKLETIKLQLQWKHQFEFAGIYAAIEKGYYKDAGLDVELVEFTNTTDITQEVVSGNAHYGISYSSIIADYANGSPIVMLANFFKQSPLVLVAQKDIKTPKDLKHKKIMGLSDNIHNITLLAMLNKFGINTGDITNIKTNFKIDDFINKKVDAMSVFTTNELYLLEKADVKYNIFDPVMYGAKYYDTNLFTSQKELDNHPQRVKNIRDASIKGWEYALNNKNEIIDLILKKYNTQKKSRDALLFEAKQTEYIMLRNVYDIGSIDIERIKTIADNFKETGFINKLNQKSLNKFIYKDKKNPLGLSKKELEFIDKNSKIVLGTDKDWEPYVFVDENKKIRGYDADVIALINEVSGLNIELKAGSWGEMQDSAKRLEIDGLSTGGVHEERKSYLNFSDIYISVQKMILISKDNEQNIKNIKDLKGKVIAIHKSNLVDEKIAAKLQNSKVMRLENLDDVISAVTTGKADATFGNGTTLYYANKIGLPYLKYAGKLDEELRLAFGVRKDWPEAISIINKSLDAIGKNRLLELKQKWFYVEAQKEFDYEIFWQFVLIVVFIIIFFLYRQYNIKQLNIKLQQRVEEELKKSQDKDTMIFHQSKLIAMGEMMENIAHQWRQPLSQINSAIYVIDDTLYEKTFQNDLVEEKMSEIESLTAYMSKTIDDFKNFYSKDKEKKNFILQNVVEDSLTILSGIFKTNNIKIDFHKEGVSFGYGYKNELEQVLIIVLNNAKDVLISRKIDNPKISISLKRVNKKYTIEICDNAGGVESDILNKIFDPYFTTKHKSQGTGLGLYMSKMIVEDSLGGDISVKNTKTGACFSISLDIVNIPES